MLSAVCALELKSGAGLAVPSVDDSFAKIWGSNVWYWSRRLFPSIDSGDLHGIVQYKFGNFKSGRYNYYALVFKNTSPDALTLEVKYPLWRRETLNLAPGES